MRIISREHEAPVFVGPGRIDVESSTAISFRMYASASDLGRAFASIKRAQQNPYETLDQFRLFATDYSETEWVCGWISPEFRESIGAHWLIRGRLRQLLTHAKAPWVAKIASTELLFSPTVRVPMSENMLTVSSINGKETGKKWEAKRHTIHVLGSEVTFSNSASRESLWITSTVSSELMHPHVENWLAEPLRVLFGQLIFPRLVARNFGDGSAHIFLQGSPLRLDQSRWLALVRPDYTLRKGEFWDLYQRLLTTVAKARNEKGTPNLESHPLTRFYEEISHSSLGSRWVQCMTLASAAEGITKLLTSLQSQNTEFDPKDIASLRSAIESWTGSQTLKERILGWFSRLGELGAGSVMRDLQRRGVLSEANVQAWSRVRNAVMHGNIASPWSSRENDERMLQLVDLIHRLTHELLDQTSPI